MRVMVVANNSDQGRHHFPHRPEEIPAPATDRPREQTAGGDPRRKRRRQPQLCGGDFRRGRTQFCQSGADVGHGVAADHRSAWLGHGGWRLSTGLSDYVVVVRGKAKLFLAGPPLLKAATGEVATDEELGGAEMHAQVAGTAEYLAERCRWRASGARDPAPAAVERTTAVVAGTAIKTRCTRSTSCSG
jgi:hypothetical protein